MQDAISAPEAVLDQITWAGFCVVFPVPARTLDAWQVAIEVVEDSVPLKFRTLDIDLDVKIQSFGCVCVDNEGSCR